MKKYLITQEQIDWLNANIEFYHQPEARRLFDSLKPIELMTTDVITAIWESDAIQGTSFGYGPFARALEAHITGGTV